MAFSVTFLLFFGLNIVWFVYMLRLWGSGLGSLGGGWVLFDLIGRERVRGSRRAPS